MSTTSIQKFDLVAGKVLQALYDKFPEAIYLDPYTSGLSNEEASWNQSGTSTNSEEWKDLKMQVLRAVKWLDEEGYIRDRTTGHNSKHVITEVGLRVLAVLSPENRPPKILTID